MTQSTLASTAPYNPQLPSPPDDIEKYWYMGRQRRWLLGLQAISFCLIAYSVGMFATADDHLLLFIIPTSLYSVTLIISLASSTRKKRVDRIGHEHLVTMWNPDAYPSVDVFLPTAGEPIELLRNTYRYVAELDWPADLCVWVLDDADRPEVAEAAAAHGFRYTVRSNRGHLKKAGNLKHGYDISGNDVILILDADFVPRRDFLRELIPYMDDPTVGIVQSPQFFETRRPMSWLQRYAGATQELFYRMIQPSRDAVGAAICVGSCAIYRRGALQQTGGFAQIGHSEDVHTGVGMLKAGFQVRYVPVNVSRGICPDTASAFLNQQYRWCTGSMSLLRDPSFHTATAINLKKRLCFWAGFLYYISTAINAFVAPIPALVMLYILPQWVKPMNSIWLLGALSLWLVILPKFMKGRWRIGVLRVQMMYSFAHALAIFDITTGRTKDWVATGAASSSTPVSIKVSRLMKTYIAGTQALLWFGLLHGAARYGVDRYWAMIALGALGTWVHLPILFIRVAKPRRRRPRVKRVAAPRESTRPAAPERPQREPARTLQVASISVRVPARIRRPKASARSGPGSARADHEAAPGQTAVATGPRRWRPDIQGLRAIAVTLVVLYHAQVPHLTGGYVGVDVFFVISGFLITGQLVREAEHSGRVRLVRFYVGRIRRLLPAAALVTVVTLLAARKYMSIFQVQSIIKDALATAVYGINYRLAAAGVNYQQATSTPSPLQHFWSLAVEEQFYIAWPMIVVLCAVIWRRRLRVVLTVVTAITLAVSLYFSITLTKSDPPMAYFAIHTRAWELGIGALIAICMPALTRLPRAVSALASWIGVAGIVYSAFHDNDATPFPGSAALLPVLATALVIIAGSQPQAVRWGAESLLRLPPMQKLGQLSYPWYLWHWPMLIIVPIAYGYDFNWKLNLQLVALSLWFALLTQHLIERTTQRGALKVFRWSGVGFACAASIVACALFVSNSLPNLNVGNGHPVVVGEANSRTLQTQLGNALGIIKMPLNLTPALPQAAHDVPVSDHDGCHADFLVIKQPACVFGDPHGVHTLVLTGDSHAQQWLPALDQEGKALHWKVVSWTKAACPFADVHVNNDSLHREFSECDTWRTITIARIKALDPDIVVVSQSDNVPGTQFSNKTWADATATSMVALNRAGLKSVYVMDTPIPQGSGPDCIASHISNVTKCIRNRNGDSIYAYAGRHEAVQQALTSVNVATVDPVNWLCAPTKCPMIVHNILVYRDASHMSATYSKFLAPMTAPLFIGRSS